MKRSRIASIIVSAGFSSRMEDFKPLLLFRDETAIERLVRTYKNGGIDDIFVVVGYRRDEIIDKLRAAQVSIVMNDDYKEGMFTSVRAGVKALGNCFDAFFMHPVDIPLVKTRTLEILMEAYKISERGILYPSFDGEIGHPPLIDCKYNGIIINSDMDGGLKSILTLYKEDSIAVPVFDHSILMDMDYKEDYERLLAYDALNAPDVAECHAILSKYQVPDRIVRHCHAVRKVADKLFESIKDIENRLNRDVLLAAALLHDLARTERNHAAVGARVLRDLGYPFVADLIAAHMDIEVSAGDAVTEAELLYLADKMVKEDAVVDLDERFRRLLAEHEEQGKVIDKINSRWASARAIVSKIGRISGKGFAYEKNYILGQTWEDL